MKLFTIELIPTILGFRIVTMLAQRRFGNYSAWVINVEQDCNQLAM